MGYIMMEDLLKKQENCVQRVTTGVTNLDPLIQGGFPEKSITLISGSPGAGKSIFCFHFLYEGIKKNEKVLYLTLDKQEEGLIFQAKNIGFDFQNAIEQGTAKFRYLDINQKLIYESMSDEILSGNYNRIVLDSITPLSEMPMYIRNPDYSPPNYSIVNAKDTSASQKPQRKHLRYIMNALESSGATSVVTSELQLGSPALSRDGISEFLADAVITLSYDPTMDRRKLSIIKMRNTKHTLKPQNMTITDNGLSLQ
jgi:KaiC/GvpD/RAD55 family RecA-like ATPase